MTSKTTNPQEAPTPRRAALSKSLLTHLAAAGTAALAASSASAQVTVVQVNENVGFPNGNASIFTSKLPGASQFQIFAAQANTSSRSLGLRGAGNGGYLRVKTQSVSGLAAVTKSPAGQKWDAVAGNIQNAGGFVIQSVSNSYRGGYPAGTKGYFAFEFKDTTNSNQMDYGWINLSVTDTSYDNGNVNIASYAYDTSGRELAMGATTNPAPAPEPSAALDIAVLSALTLGAAGVRKMKSLRA